MQTILAPRTTRPDPEFDVSARYAMHDIYGLISTIDAVANACQRADDSGMKRQGDRLERCSKRLAKICSDATSKDLDQEWLPDRSLGELLQDAATFAKDHADPASHVMAVCTIPDCYPDNADTVFRIVYNLAVNAVRAVNGIGGGDVILRAGLVDGAVAVDVIDNGPGFVRSIVSPRRLLSRKRPGMGIQIAELLADAMGASLLLHRSSTRGSTFRLLFKEGAGGRQANANASPVGQ